MNRINDPWHNLADAASEDVVAASPAALAAEAEQERGAGDAFALDFDRIVTRAERQARWRRFAHRLRALAASLASVLTSRPSWRPVLATVASLAVIVVAGDLFLYQRAGVPTEPVARTSPKFAPKPRADTLAPQPSLEAERGGDKKDFASAPAVPAPPPVPGGAVADAPKPAHSAPTRIGDAAHNSPVGQARARAAAPPLSLPDRDAVLSLTQEQRSRAATVQRKAASQPSAPQIAAVPAEPPPSSAVVSGGLAPPPFIWPLRGELIAGFGATMNGRHNDGIDIAVPVGSDIRAAADGVVVYAGADIEGYGNLVLLRHGDGFVTAYGHADKVVVEPNDVVHRGQVIAKSGTKSGRTGDVPLLHFEIRKGSTPVDPMQFLPRG
ncbi:MAG TPA: M23 family metallopeptidase [Xanthobacteraceae bacterium]|nr:M23 family metallopeptidase [Xanthobacteraceae bacterium]